jgi:phosphohistidine phosphatase
VRVYLCRHAEAAPGDPDELRELTAEGRRQARALGARLAGLAEPPATVLTSPLVRARRTAEAIAAETGAALRLEPALGPGATVDDLRGAVAGVADPVAAVAHQPDCSDITVLLTGSDPGFAPGSMTVLHVVT